MSLKEIVIAFLADGNIMINSLGKVLNKPMQVKKVWYVRDPTESIKNPNHSVIQGVLDLYITPKTTVRVYKKQLPDEVFARVCQKAKLRHEPKVVK